jgi:hypothetical protein
MSYLYSFERPEIAGFDKQKCRVTFALQFESGPVRSRLTVTPER